MRRYPASLLVQESGFHQLVAEFSKGRGITRASLAQEVAIAVAKAMTSFSQVCTERSTSIAPYTRLGSVFPSECVPYPGRVYVSGYPTGCFSLWSIDRFLRQRSLRAGEKIVCEMLLCVCVHIKLLPVQRMRSW